MKLLRYYQIVFTAIGIVFTGEAFSDVPEAEIILTSVMCKQPGRYIGWPTITRTENNELIAVFSGDRDEHVCPWGKTQMVRSSDNGKTWSVPKTVNNTPLDDRDAGIITTKNGLLIVSWFTSLAFDNPRYHKHYPETVVKSWERHAEKLSPEIREQWLGCWIRRSADSGKTWGEHIKLRINAPHGPIQLTNGHLLYVGKTLWEEKKSLLAAESRDEGKTWEYIGTIPVRPGESIDHYHELHAVEREDGAIIAMIRYNPPERENNIMRQSESYDGGKSWTVPHETGIWGYPPHLIRLRDGRLVVVYGHRREPFGERACVSEDGGKSWQVDNSIELQGAMNGDLGYPASTVLSDGSIYTVYYQIDKEGEKTCLMGTHWKLK